MTESTTQYIPEQHAPDPVIGHGDPTPPGKLGLWLFLASEIMFFTGILGSYIVLRSAQPQSFARHAQALGKPLAGINTLVLIFSSLTMALSVDAAQKHNRHKLIRCLLITFLCGCVFLGIKSIEYAGKFQHHTVVARETDGRIFVYDGHVEAATAPVDEIALKGYRAPLSPGVPFDIHLISQADVKAGSDNPDETLWRIPLASVSQDQRYGPSKNMFYACYFTLTGVHGVHVIAGLIPLLFLLIQAGHGKIFPAHTEYVGLYWHFVDLVWIFLFPLLYLV